MLQKLFFDAAGNGNEEEGEGYHFVESSSLRPTNSPTTAPTKVHAPTFALLLFDWVCLQPIVCVSTKPYCNGTENFVLPCSDQKECPHGGNKIYLDSDNLNGYSGHVKYQCLPSTLYPASVGEDGASTAADVERANDCVTASIGRICQLVEASPNLGDSETLQSFQQLTSGSDGMTFDYAPLAIQLCPNVITSSTGSSIPPTGAPTKAPTNMPTTVAPTDAPTTDAPTKVPLTNLV